ncbi:MAG: hypothetical protein IJR94_03060, partial [Synergistaceae bacterium]|nr:hypothetical protein [Synergistaceae bacterium]
MSAFLLPPSVPFIVKALENNPLATSWPSPPTLPPQAVPLPLGRWPEGPEGVVVKKGEVPNEMKWRVLLLLRCFYYKTLNFNLNLRDHFAV